MTVTQDQLEEEPTRRDFIHLLAAGMSGMAVVGVAVPLVDQMNPDASVRALSTKEVDIASLSEGEAIKVFWQGKPVFIRHRTAEEIAAAEETPISALKDDEARNANIAAGDEASDVNRVINPAYMVVVGVCTHLGCVPLGSDQGDNRGDYNGWFCPCHGSHYDTSGRIRKGPAPENLAVPPYEFLTDTVIKIG
ncbi:MAG: ubiquinol-cytochrome c reductase iron-sulfur subunit [Pseudomonadota bacterium]